MTPKEIQSEMVKFKAEVGPHAHVSYSLQDYGKPIYASIHPFGIINSDGYLSIGADDWAEAVTKLRAEWSKHEAEHHRQTVRNMALAIIRLTTESGECTDAALRAEFDAGSVSRWGNDACKLADEMAGRGPFCIKEMRGANAA